MKSWLKTIFEAWIDVGSGFFVALLVQLTLIPLFFGISFFWSSKCRYCIYIYCCKHN